MAKRETQSNGAGKNCEYKGKKFSFAPADEQLARARESWSWLDVEIEDFIKSDDMYRNVVVDSFTFEEARHLNWGLRCRLSVRFKDSGVILVSRSVYDENRKRVGMKMQLAKKDKKQ